MTDRTPVATHQRRALTPFRDLPPLGVPVDWLRTELDRLFEGFGQPAPSLFKFADRGEPVPVPALEITQDETGYKLTAELPGLTEQDVDVSVADGVLLISGEKKEEGERKDKGFLFSERRYGAFERRIALPADVDHNGISAQFKDGILTVMLAKDRDTSARSRKIEIGKG